MRSSESWYRLILPAGATSFLTCSVVPVVARFNVTPPFLLAMDLARITPC